MTTPYVENIWRLSEMMYHLRQWREARQDPYRDELLANGPPDLDKMATLFERPTIVGHGFDPDVIHGNIERLVTCPEINLGHPLLDLSVKTGLAHIDATFQGDHPKYGLGYYGRNKVDGFPQIIIAVVDALTAWGLTPRATQLWRYWVRNMIHPDGVLTYPAACLGEYGQLLHTAARLEEHAGPAGWWEESFPILDRMAERLLDLRRTALAGSEGLIAGPADEDLHSDRQRFFHTNAWVAAGLKCWADLCERRSAVPATPAAKTRQIAGDLADETLRAICKTWPSDPADWWLPPCVEPVERPRFLTDTKFSSYTNYRYYPELLSSGILPRDLAERVVATRLNGGGQFCGMTRFMDWTDNWPLAEYLDGLWRLGRKNDFLLSLYGHVVFQQDKETLTACEQLTFPPGQPMAPYCLVCQLAPARAARLLQ
ncbi:MAG: hypothetical protein HY360_09535 [Verrucomicrobia bacterium]|nr:hypothetical protein [Verrucomicrobiota bacterium]